MPGSLRSLLDRCATSEDDQVGERDLLASGLRRVELLLDALENGEGFRELGRLVDLPVFLRREPEACSVRPAPLVRAAEGGRRGPRGRDELRAGQPGGQDFVPRAAMSFASMIG